MSEYRVGLSRHDGARTERVVNARDEDGARREARYYDPELRVTKVEKVEKGRVS